MRASDTWVIKMNVQCSIFKLLLFQLLVAWCGAKHITYRDSPQLVFPDGVEADVQESIRNHIHTGIYSHRHLDTSKTEVVRPVRVSREGHYLSHHVDHQHEHGHARARRDLHGIDHVMDHTLHYNLTVGGRELRIDLRPSVSFITPALVVERHTAVGRSRHRPREQSTGCHYTGEVRGQRGTRVALSACDGLAGVLRTEHGEYWIEPSNHINEDGSEGRAHVIFKRAAVDKEAAWHRAKRAVDGRTNNNISYNRKTNINRPDKYSRRQNTRSQERKLMTDKQRREYLEARRKQLEELRRNPTEYRLHQMRQRIQQRTRQAFSSSISRSRETSEIQGRNRNKHNGRRPRVRPRRRRKRSKNCATKQPPYQWNKKNSRKPTPNDLYRNNMSRSRNPRQHQGGRSLEQSRRARSVSKPRHVEALLVADKSMTEFHNSSNLETYLLTIMNMVSSLYMDPSIGNYIKVVVVKIILVEDLAAGHDLEVSTNADTTLNSFCKWQQTLNPDNDDNPHHHDVAILITRQDICSQHDTPCSTLGVAHVAGMCKPDRSCSVNEDNGITLAHTITHELGHNFGLYHDTEKIGCHRREGATLHIMTPIFEADTVQVAWSRCSKRDVTNFLDAGLGECLGDRPSQEEYVYPEVPAGVTFDAATQCLLQFGAEAQVCTDPEEICTHLWCLVNNTCKTMMRPAAPGTSCGQDMWCQNLKCVPRAPIPQPRDGGWGPWSSWSECSRTCGGGVSTQSRECNNPEPENNGKYCIGERSRYKVCNTDACPIGDKSFREVQCEKYTNITHNNETFNDWVPYFDQDKPCELTCMPRNRNDIDMIGGFVADGTPCRQTDGARDMCIAGVCHKVGCDWVVDSDAEEDACGVCGGDGSACKTVLGIYNKGTTKQSGFSEVAVIPKGSRNVKIEEKVSPGNYISIGSAKTRKFLMNGARNQTLTEYFVAGSHAIYERDRDWEKVRITGPIAEDIKVYQRIYRGKHRNPGVTYQYTVDNVARRQRPVYRYRLSDWSPCSVTCGVGYTRRHVQCVDHRDVVVEQQQCYHIESPPHDAMMAVCRQPACAAPPPQRTHWWVGPWSPCDRACTLPGVEATKRRNVYCVDKESNKVIADSLCDQSIKPMSSIKCADVLPC